MKTQDASPEAFFQRWMRASVVITVVVTLLSLNYIPPGVALRYLVFSAWMLLNLLAWKYGLKEFLGGKRRLLVLAPLFAIKLAWFAILILFCSKAGLRENSNNFFAFLLGINTPFLVALLKAWGRVLTQAGERPRFARSILRSQVAEKNDLTDK